MSHSHPTSSSSTPASFPPTAYFLALKNSTRILCTSAYAVITVTMLFLIFICMQASLTILKFASTFYCIFLYFFFPRYNNNPFNQSKITLELIVKAYAIADGGLLKGKALSYELMRRIGLCHCIKLLW